MKPYVVVAFMKEMLREVHVPDMRGSGARRAYATLTPNTGLEEDSNIGINTVYFFDNQRDAEMNVINLSIKWPMYTFIVAKTTQLVEMPRQLNSVPEIKQFTEKGVLP